MIERQEGGGACFCSVRYSFIISLFLPWILPSSSSVISSTTRRLAPKQSKARTARVYTQARAHTRFVFARMNATPGRACVRACVRPCVDARTRVRLKQTKARPSPSCYTEICYPCALLVSLVRVDRFHALLFISPPPRQTTPPPHTHTSSP